MRVLYVEDDRVNGILFIEGLRAVASEIECRVAEDGPEALETAAAWRPDVLVIDAHLGDTDGFTLLPQLRAIDGLAHVPAAMCSADNDPASIERSTSVGFAAYWTKPLEPTSIESALRQLLDSRTRCQTTCSS